MFDKDEKQKRFFFSIIDFTWFFLLFVWKKGKKGLTKTLSFFRLRSTMKMWKNCPTLTWFLTKFADYTQQPHCKYFIIQQQNRRTRYQKNKKKMVASFISILIVLQNCDETGQGNSHLQWHHHSRGNERAGRCLGATPRRGVLGAAIRFWSRKVKTL